MARYEVYWNLHKGLWSIRQEGLVVDRLSRLIIVSVKFKVQEGGRQRVIRTRRKNVHAFVTGAFIFNHPEVPRFEGVKVKYNPYKAGFFYSTVDGREVVAAHHAVLYNTKEVITMNPVYGERTVC